MQRRDKPYFLANETYKSRHPERDEKQLKLPCGFEILLKYLLEFLTIQRPTEDTVINLIIEELENLVDIRDDGRESELDKVPVYLKDLLVESKKALDAKNAENGIETNHPIGPGSAVAKSGKLGANSSVNVLRCTGMSKETTVCRSSEMSVFQMPGFVPAKARVQLLNAEKERGDGTARDGEMSVFGFERLKREVGRVYNYEKTREDMHDGEISVFGLEVLKEIGRTSNDEDQSVVESINCNQSNP